MPRARLNKGRLNYTPRSWTNKKVLVVKNENECPAAVDELKSQLDGNNVLGIHCEWNGNDKGVNSSRVAVLLIASYHDVVVLFQIFNYKNFPIELKELLEDEQVVKVDSANVRHRLIDYNINVANAFDLCALPILCGCNRGTLYGMCKEYLKLELYKCRLTNKWQSPNLRNERVIYAVNNVRACIELYKFFVQKLQPDAEPMDAEQVKCKIIGRFGNQFIYTPVDDVKVSAETKLKKSYVPLLQNKNCVKLLDELKCNSDEYKVIGFDCESDILSIKFDKRMAMLNLASLDGTCVFIRLSDGVSITALKKILEDDRIVKVGVSPQHNAKCLERYGIRATSMFDLRYMAESCGVQSDDLPTMLRTQIENQSLTIANDFLTSHAHAAVTLFQTFAKKLQAELEINVEKVVEEFCVPNFDRDFDQKKDRLQIGKVHVIIDAEQCSQVMAEIKTHCAEYNVLGLDCEWVGSSNVALLQLATHRGLCALIRLCFFRKLPTEVKEILEDANIIKVGKDVFNDAKKLNLQHRLHVANLLDVGAMAKICGFRDGGLGSMTEAFLNAKRYKTKTISCSNWEKLQLTERQIEYAAKDAQAGFELFKFFAEKMEMNLTFNVGKDYVNYVVGKYFAYLVNK